MHLNTRDNIWMDLLKKNNFLYYYYYLFFCLFFYMFFILLTKKLEQHSNEFLFFLFLNIYIFNFFYWIYIYFRIIIRMRTKFIQMNFKLNLWRIWPVIRMQQCPHLNEFSLSFEYNRGYSNTFSINTPTAHGSFE